MFFPKILIGGVFAMLQMQPAAAIPINATAIAPINATMPASMTLARRIIDVDTVDCHDEWYEEPAVRTKIAITKFIREGMEYLRHVAGVPKLGPGSNNCERVSCSNWSAIAWCNHDPDNSNELPSYETIAEAAEIILAWCKASKKELHIKGQVYSKQKWSVVIEGDLC
ncbi:hypothetical protein NEUTE1DRAFT_36086 [Neurospora tetrasperma FGSC 2508]|uniref:Ecp2 effector protein domain-containing protein n=1 Tax=Neurospora tetrasperma (strain FGSC 2508 / ATCC MYA-4615 / P0657) TaxID=510951 RepID=F8MEE8_NEUT8|nr:uncharacterized protein NEUTE1DRAFT_36086 [Neurospora tetrasperma FGSC 2508]EGO61630.1 hypothetical protein NEUTE1DRAFT_36086 [Neurospora tetrasperma FGSC 2508]EGZ74323.1 hypothetical protein NEUTE2DRAFT_163374 [Neurospora tetrasperma FGSC 2509]